MEKSQKLGKKQEKGESLRVSFDSRLYSKDAVAKAAFDYGKIADVTISTEGNVIVASISSKKDIDSLDKEFSNYVLGLMVNEGY